MAPERISEHDTPAIELSEAAREKLRQVLASRQGEVPGLRLQIVSRLGGEFQHVLSFAESESQVQDDVRVEVEGIPIYCERTSVPYLNGIRIHYVDKGPHVSGLEYENPNPLWWDETEQLIQDIFDHEINPAIASHGGYVGLLGVRGDAAYVQLGGGCQGCGLADVTLKQGIEATILERVPGIRRVIDQTDHAAGTNPYYQPAKK